MFERFTDRARRVVVAAQEEARRLQHNYIGTEHILLGLIYAHEGVAARALRRFGLTLDETRDEVVTMIGRGQHSVQGHIPFTPRAKKTLELALREALQLSHNYIGTEHILLGLIREGDGVAAQIMRKHADLLTIRMGVLDVLPPTSSVPGRRRAWLRRLAGGETDAPAAQQTMLSATPAVDATLSEAARLAGAQPVASHHLLMAVISDSGSAAARALATLGIDLDQARTALRDVDIAGTSDEPPEEAGRRAMTIRLDGERVIVEAADPVILDAAKAALSAAGDDQTSTVINGDTPVAASLSNVWQALRDSLESIERTANAAAEAQAPEASDPPDASAS